MMSAEAKPGLRISAVVPLFNGSRYIEEALISVLKQTLPPDDIIVVDDGSVDEGPSIIARMAKNHPITLVEGTNGGPSAARNLGVRHATGDLIAFLGQNDSWLQCHLEVRYHPS
jgi:glycosyltransferase involved in cell wall biosynthesis